MKKSTTLTLICLMLSHNISQARTTTLPTLECWDGTFAYNKLETKMNDGKLDFISSGQDLGIYSNLIELPDDNRWGEVTMSFSIPQDECTVATKDARIITCQAKSLTINLSGTIGVNGKIEETIKMTDTVVQLRKVTEQSLWGNETSGYELVITNRYVSNHPILIQKYFYGMEKDETDKCKIMN